MAADALNVRKVETPKDFKAFFEFPWTVYKGDPNWVPPLLSMRRHLLDKKKNPSWEYMEGDYFVAWRGTKPVGTIAAFINHRHNETWNEKIGWFGFFECLNDSEAANALLETASNYIRAKGYTAIRGPASFTLNDECGLLIDNFSPPLILMPYNHPYYQQLIEGNGLGFNQVMDTVSFYTDPSHYFDNNGEMPTKLTRVVKLASERNGVTTRFAEVKVLKQELELLRQIYQTAWEKNWGFVPPTEKEMDDLFKALKDYFHPGLGVFGLVNGKPGGFMLGLPDMNQPLHHAYPRPGEPELWTLLKVLWHWKIRPKITQQRVLLFGVNPEYRGMGVDAAIFLTYLTSSIKSKYPRIDAGWILATNAPVVNQAKMFKAKDYKRYRFYQRQLS